MLSHVVPTSNMWYAYLFICRRYQISYTFVRLWPCSCCVAVDWKPWIKGCAFTVLCPCQLKATGVLGGLCQFPLPLGVVIDACATVSVGAARACVELRWHATTITSVKRCEKHELTWSGHVIVWNHGKCKVGKWKCRHDGRDGHWSWSSMGSEK